jgi:single-stranded-DNA-specific exonuclease
VEFCLSYCYSIADVSNKQLIPGKPENMIGMKIWNILNTFEYKDSSNIHEEIIKLLLENRGFITKKSMQDFLNPRLESVTVESVGLDKRELDKALKRISEAIGKKEQIVVYGDYDVDGITGSAILWETLNELGAKVMPYLPDRVEEGYGLSVAGIQNSKFKIQNIKLIITVDNGIVANEAVDFANSQGIDVIVTDHHTPPVGGGEKLPEALAIVHTTKLCGAGVAYLLSKELRKSRPLPDPLLKGEGEEDDIHLELAALGTVADMVPLTGANRAIVKFGLEKLCKTRRPGLQALFRSTGCDKEAIGVYEVGFLIGPRLNAAGRIDSAMDSLRLLCTKDKSKARDLAEKLELTNRERQLLMRQAAEHASLSVKMRDSLKKILVVAHESYQEGVIGLVAGKLVEEFYRPSIVISRGEKVSKASVRSVEGFNVIEFLRTTPEYFVNVGGHPMAAGFTIETEKILAFQALLETNAEELLDDEALMRRLRVDCELPLSTINQEFYHRLQELGPFGMGNPQPVFVTRGVRVRDMKVLGREGKHLKLVLEDSNSELRIMNYGLFDGIGFGMGEMAREIDIGDEIDIAYTIDENTWNGNTKLQLKVRDIKL